MSKEEKRFQECNWLVKVWRYRWYIPIPFKWLYFMYIKPFLVRETALNEEKGYIEDTGEFYRPKGKNLWGLLKGIAQGKMKWYYTSEEVMERIRDKF
jgi:hypothetical protein